MITNLCDVITFAFLLKILHFLLFVLLQFFKPRLHNIQPVVKPVVKPVDNRVNVCIHDTTGCQTGLTTGCIVYTALNRGRHLCSAGRPSRWPLAHILVCKQLTEYHDHKFVKPDWQPVGCLLHDTAGCQTGLTTGTGLYRVNGVLDLSTCKS